MSQEFEDVHAVGQGGLNVLWSLTASTVSIIIPKERNPDISYGTSSSYIFGKS